MKGITLVSLLAGGAVVGGMVHAHRAGATAPMTVSVTLKDYKVILIRRRLPVGKPITFVITNRGHHTHEFVLEAATAFDQAIRYHSTTYEADEIKPGTTRKVTWIIPQKGSYKLACHIDHHYQMGMKTLVTVANT
jgi:uncharacterized cupredoxin-like copper-binding protein